MMDHLNSRPTPKSWIWFPILLLSGPGEFSSLASGIDDPLPRYWIPSAGTPPSHTVNWSPTGPSATLAPETFITATVTFTDGQYTPGHWSDATPAPAPQVWPWIAPAFFPETVRLSQDKTKGYIKITGSHAIDMGALGMGNVDQSRTAVGRFNVLGGNNPNNRGDGGPLQPSEYDYDP